MPTYARFEDLPVWKTAIELATSVFLLTGNRLFRGTGDTARQLRRASLSISNNIAEGYERGSTRDLIGFLYIARGSAGEVRSILRFLEGHPPAAELRPELQRLIGQCESCSRQLYGWARALQDSKVLGPRHLNREARAAWEADRVRDDFEVMERSE